MDFPTIQSIKKRLKHARLHKNYDGKAVPSWHAPTYLILMVDKVVEELNQGVDENSDNCQVIGDVRENLSILHT